MDAANWGQEFAEARRLLIECADFAMLRERGHELKDGVVLTSMSDAPFEMSFKCARCGAAFWFENIAWHTGGIAQWRLNEGSRALSSDGCHPKATQAAQSALTD